jgi:gamma-glutamyltranspeptidase/glutathione hydrolase
MLATVADGSLSHLVGAMGGDAQPQILLQLMARMLGAGEDPATAIAAPRLALDSPTAGPFRLWWGDDLGVRIEAHAPSAWAGGLGSRGHHVRAISAFDPVVVGCAQIISVARDGDGNNQRFIGASDPRSPGGGTSAR